MASFVSERPDGASPPLAPRRIEPPRSKPSPPPPRHPPRAQGLAICAVSAAVGLAGLAVLGRQALADRLLAHGDPAAHALALRIDPGNPLAHRRAAEHAVAETGDPAAGVEPLRRAAALAPLDPDLPVELAHLLAASGQAAEGEAVLVQAARSGEYRPNWELANLYLRQGRTDEYWERTRAAIRERPRAAGTVFGLAWRAFDDAGAILANGVPDEPDINRFYFDYLLDTERLDALRGLWPRLDADLQPRDLPSAALFVDRLIAARDVPFALGVWNRLCESGLVPYRPLALPDGPFVTNGEFATPVSGLGFDWSFPPSEGILRLQLHLEEAGLPAGTNALELRLSGAQTDDSILLRQVVPLPAGRRLLFRYETASQGLPRRTGLYWTVRDAQTGEPIVEAEPIEASEDSWASGSLPIDGLPADGFARIELRYRRDEGAARHQGRLLVRLASLAAAPERE